MTKRKQNQSDSQPLPTASQARVSMEPLYELLLKKTFPDNVSAIEYCRSICSEFGFTVKQEASANRNIYVYCSREGLPDSMRKPVSLPQRKRPSKRCDCRWRVVLSENDQSEWEFRKSMNPNASFHNHEMMSPSEIVKAWPPEVNSTIVHLAQQRLQTHDIREAIKERFPDLPWNERRFYNRLTEERKRIRQRSVVERAQRILPLAVRLCALVAHQEDWAYAVEHHMKQHFENFCQLGRLPAESIQNLTDLDSKSIKLELDSLSSPDNDSTDKNPVSYYSKKKKPTAQNTGSTSGPRHEHQRGIQTVFIPSYTIRLHTSISSPSISNLGQSVALVKKGIHDSPHSANASNLSTTHHLDSTQPLGHVQNLNSPHPLHSQHLGSSHPMNSSPHHLESSQSLSSSHPLSSSSHFFALASPTSSPSSSSSNTYQHHQRVRAMQSPKHAMSHEFMMSHNYQTTHQGDNGFSLTPNPSQPNHSYPIQSASFSPYNISTSAFTSPSELQFHFEPSSSLITRQSEPTTGHSYQNPIKHEVSLEHQSYGKPSRSSSHSKSQQSNYPLPMIRSNKGLTEDTHWS